MNNEEIKEPMHYVGMVVGVVLMGFLFGIGYNLSLMLFN